MGRDTLMREVLRGSAIAFALKVLGAALSFGFYVLLARLLGAEGVGTYMLALTVATVAGVLGRAGLDNAMLRFIAARRAAADPAGVRGVFATGLQSAWLFSLLAAMAVWVSAPWLARQVFDKPQAEAALQWIALAVVPLVLVWILAAALRGLERIRDAHLVESVAVPGLSMTLLALSTLRGPAGVTVAIQAFVLANTVAAATGYALWRRATHELRRVRGVFSRTLLLRTGFPLMWVASMQLVNGWIAVITLGIFRPVDDVGQYGVALRTALLVNFVLAAFGSIAAPKFAALHGTGDHHDLARVAIRSTRTIVLLTLPVLATFLVFPRPVLMLFGGEFDGAAPVLRILALGQFVSVSCGLVGRLLAMTGHERTLRNLLTLTALINIGLCLVLVPRAGIVGAAIATATSWAVTNIAALIATRRRIGIGPHLFARL